MKTNTIVKNKKQMCRYCMCCMDEYGFKKQAVVINI